MPYKPGSSGNPGGLTSEERKARDVMRRWLAGDSLVEETQAAYLQLLQERNHVIVMDAMNRLAGKVKDILEATGENGAPLLPPLTPEALTNLIDLLKKAKP